MRNWSLALALSAISFMPMTAYAAPEVVASIKPLHSIVAYIMKDVGTPDLLVKGAASPHSYSLRPSDARMLQKAQLVFWMGPGLEAFLVKPLSSLSGNATVVEMEDQTELTRLPFREGGPFEAHDHGDADGHDHADHDDHAHAGPADHDHDHAEADEHGHDHAHEGYDMHLWLDPENGKVIGEVVADALVKADPDNAAVYRANLRDLKASLDLLNKDIAATLAPVKDRPFIVFHDAYQYFEKRYGVTVAGSVTVSPEHLPGAERISQIHDKITSLDARCIFAEPQFQSSLIKSVSDGTNAKAATLDPLGSELADGPELYPTLLRNLAASMRDCLQG